MNSSTWLVTGGAGYIGAHVVRSLMQSGRGAVVLDDLSTGSPERVPSDVGLSQGSVLDTPFITRALRQVRPVGVVHLAAKKSPTESMTDPLFYARENVGGIISLLQAMRSSEVTRLVFSSSCSVYGTPDSDLVDEHAPLRPESPYGESKAYGERLLQASARAYGISAISLRYFNVVGAASPALRDGGAHNLVPLVFRAIRARESSWVWGDDYATPDGTCVRDYVDVEDLADAHVRAAENLERQERVATYNVGRGEGSSVLQVLEAVRAVTGLPVPYKIGRRRPGDPAHIVGSVERIAADLGWRAQRTLNDMVGSAWRAEPKR